MRRAAPAWAASWSQGCGDVSRIGKQPVALPDGVEITIEPELVSVKGPKGELAERKNRDIEGVGYRANLQGRKLVLALGYSHPVELEAPEGIDFEVPQPTRIIVRGISKQAVGEVAANIRKQRPPEPYKGKGIRYEGEYVARKVGKRA